VSDLDPFAEIRTRIAEITARVQATVPDLGDNRYRLIGKLRADVTWLLDQLAEQTEWAGNLVGLLDAAGKRGDRLAAENERLRHLLDLARPVLAYVGRGRHYVGVEPYPDTAARTALGEWTDTDLAGGGE
jgi:uncharacterized phage protein gp47/JayE